MKRSLLLITLLLSLSVMGQQRVLTLEEAVAAALQQNYDIQLSRNDSVVAALNHSYADWALWPQVNANGGYQLNNNNQRQTLADGRKIERNGIRANNLNASINLNWTLFDGLRMFITRKRLGELVHLGELQVQTQVVATVADVMRSYFEMARLQQQKAALDEQMRLSGERLQLAQYKFDIGTGTKADVLQAQIDNNAQRAQLLGSENALVQAREQLALLMASKPGEPFNVHDSIPVNRSLLLDSVRKGIEAVNPQLLLNRQQQEIAGLMIRERKAERWPTVNFNSAYNFNRNENKTVINPFQPLFNQNRGFNYGFTATVPIFNGFSVRRNIRAAEIDLEQLQLQYRRSEAVIASGIAQAWQGYELARNTLSLEEANMTLVRENLFIARERYRLGVSTFIEMRIAEQNLADAQFRLIQARFNTKLAEIQLLQLRGDIIR